MLSDLQQRKIERMFEILDTDANGYIEPSDLVRLAGAVATAVGLRPTSPEFEAIRWRYLASWDEARPFFDRRGRVGREDYLRYHEQLVSMPAAFESRMRSLADFVFSLLDADGDGRITQDELSRFQQAHGVPESLSRMIFPLLDLDGDGHVSAAEMREMLPQYFLSADPAEPGNWLFGPIEVPIEAR
ncbi:MAG TPA: EF-hand domain-containing protein [Longimicrobiales bacterium]|nr:EF-hand domain-containing protein [Longimicrobiales bacterium]